MDNVLIVVDDLEVTKAFFIDLGLRFEGETTVEGVPQDGDAAGISLAESPLAIDVANVEGVLRVHRAPRLGQSAEAHGLDRDATAPRDAAAVMVTSDGREPDARAAHVRF